MTVFVFTRPENAKSAVKLGYPVVTERSSIPNDAVVIRWGKSDEPDVASWPLVLNKRSVLQTSIDKPAALQSLSRVVATPPMYRAGEMLPAGHRYVARPATHAEGSDFNIVNGGSECEEDHATRLIEGCREYRVFFVRNNYLVAKRIPRSSEGQSSADVCRSKWGYQFQDECFPKLAEEMAKARTAIPLDFGAVDVLWKDGERGQEGKWYFLEVNSAPSMDHDRVLRHFQTHLQAILRTFRPPEVPQAVQPPARAANRPPEPPFQPAVNPSALMTWEQRYEAKLIAERKAKEQAIYKKVYGDV